MKKIKMNNGQFFHAQLESIKIDIQNIRNYEGILFSAEKNEMYLCDFRNNNCYLVKL